MDATRIWLPNEAEFDPSRTRLDGMTNLTVSRSLAELKNWTATQSIHQIRRELELIRQENPDLYEALAKDDPNLIK